MKCYSFYTVVLETRKNIIKNYIISILFTDYK